VDHVRLLLEAGHPGVAIYKGAARMREAVRRPKIERELERGLGQDVLAREVPETVDFPEDCDERRKLGRGRRQI
jgi:hypothetical protein